jgi:DNA repair exonuclease SbcCD ATPase subunit
MIMAEPAASLANHWPELLLGLILLYASIALLLAVIVLIGGRLQVRTNAAIKRLTEKVSELAERSADTKLSGSAGAGTAEIIGAMERLSAKIDKLAERPGSTAQAEDLIPIAAELRTAIERLAEKTEQLAAPRPVEAWDEASHHYALDEVKAGIEALTIDIRQLSAGIQNIQKPTAEIERWRRGVQQELRDVLKELK